MPASNATLFDFVRGLPATQRALAFAQTAHRDQQRAADGARFLVHPVEVAALLARLDYDDEVVAAAVLHDVLEDTDAQRADLEAHFGRRVAELVALVSDDPDIPDQEARKDDVRERVRRAGSDALAVYAADKVSKVRELRMLITGGLERRQVEIRLARYRASLVMLQEQMGDSHLVRLLRFELEALLKLPPQRVA